MSAVHLIAHNNVLLQCDKIGPPRMVTWYVLTPISHSHEIVTQMFFNSELNDTALLGLAR